MGFTQQYQDSRNTDFDDMAVARPWTRPWNSRLGSASQPQQVIFENPNGCAQYWESWVDIDLRFATAYSVDPDRTRIIVTLKSASGPPSVVCSGADVHELARWDHDIPANFGGDGHGYWAVYYVVPTQEDIDFAGSSGASRIGNFFTCAGDLPSGLGNYGDGVALIYDDQEEYVATFGSATASVSVSQAALPQDAVFFWYFPEVRTIDDIDLEKQFHTFDESIFDHDETRHNAGIPEQDVYLDGRDERAGVMSVTCHFQVTATADVFPGSCRVYTAAFSCDLRALCPV